MNPSSSSSTATSDRIDCQQELFRVEVLNPLFVLERKEGIIAQWDSLQWKSYMLLADAICPAVESIAGLSVESILPAELVTRPCDNECRPNVAYICYADVGLEQINLIDATVKRFCASVLEPVDLAYSGEECRLTDANKQLIDEHAARFLDRHHGKSIVAPYQILLPSGAQIACIGNFRQKLATNPIPDTTPSIFEGNIVEIHIKQQSITIESGNNESQRLFLSTHQQFRQCCDAARDHICNTYKSQKRPTLAGKVVSVVIEINPSQPESDLFSDSR